MTTTTELPSPPRKRKPVTQEDRDILNYQELRNSIDWITTRAIHNAHQANPSSYFPGYSGNERVSGGSIPDPTARVALEDRHFKLDPTVERVGQLFLSARLMMEEAVELLMGDTNWRTCAECHVRGPLAAHGLCVKCYQRQWRRQKRKKCLARTNAMSSDQPVDAVR